MDEASESSGDYYEALQDQYTQELFVAQKLQNSAKQGNQLYLPGSNDDLRERKEQ